MKKFVRIQLKKNLLFDIMRTNQMIIFDILYRFILIYFLAFYFILFFSFLLWGDRHRDNSNYCGFKGFSMDYKYELEVR